MTEIINQARRPQDWRPAAQMPVPELIDDPAPVRWSLASEIEAERAHWFSWTPVVLGAGALLYFQLTFEPPVWSTVVPIALVCGLWLSQRRRRRQGINASLLLTVLIGLLVGFVSAKVRTEMVRAPVIEKRTGLVEVAGFVELIDPSARRGQRLTIRPYRVGTLTADNLPRRVRIRVLNPLRDLSPGAAIIVKAKLSPPAAPALPGGFDFARYAWFQKIGGVGYALSRPTIDDAPPPLPRWFSIKSDIESVRRHISKRVYSVLAGQTGAISAALITGERGGISDDTNKLYRDAGLFHVLSISGMHMAIMAGTVFFLSRLLFAAIPGLVLRYPVKKWAAVIAALGALGYLLISGSAFATVRSYLMITVMFFAVLVDRPALALRNVALAALILLLLFPESSLDPGFQMSFAAVTALISSYEVMRRRGVGARFANAGLWTKGGLFIAGVVASTFIAGLAVAPIAAYHFHTTQHFAVLANVVAMPVSNVIVMPAALMALLAMPLGLEAVPLMVMGFGVDLMTYVAGLVAALPGAIGHVVAMPDGAILVMALGMLWLMLWQRPWRLLGLVIFAAGLALTPFSKPADVIIGNDGNDVLVRTEDGTLAALRATKPSFETQRWMEHAGTPLTGRKAKLPVHPGARCDSAGCTVTVKGLQLAKSDHGAALRDDCRRAGILILDRPRPRGCEAPNIVVDFFDARYEGTHTLTIAENGEVELQTVAKTRGKRPWTVALPGRRPWPGNAASRTSPRNRTGD